MPHRVLKYPSFNVPLVRDDEANFAHIGNFCFKHSAQGARNWCDLWLRPVDNDALGVRNDGRSSEDQCCK